MGSPEQLLHPTASFFFLPSLLFFCWINIFIISFRSPASYGYNFRMGVSDHYNRNPLFSFCFSFYLLYFYELLGFFAFPPLLFLLLLLLPPLRFIVFLPPLRRRLLNLPATRFGHYIIIEILNNVHYCMSIYPRNLFINFYLVRLPIKPQAYDFWTSQPWFDLLHFFAVVANFFIYCCCSIICQLYCTDDTRISALVRSRCTIILNQRAIRLSTPPHSTSPFTSSLVAGSNFDWSGLHRSLTYP